MLRNEILRFSAKDLFFLGLTTLLRDGAAAAAAAGAVAIVVVFFVVVFAVRFLLEREVAAVDRLRPFADRRARCTSAVAAVVVEDDALRREPAIDEEINVFMSAYTQRRHSLTC